MSIPEAQLKTWSHQGSVTQSSDTYQTIRRVLVASSTKFASRRFGIFLQGSYGNDTNIYAESDVDIVIRLDAAFQADIEDLNSVQKAAFNALPDATYGYSEFKQEVLETLQDAYGTAVDPGNKAIAVAAGGGRRKADVVVATQHRRYFKFNSLTDQRFAEGIQFYDSSGTTIINFPKQHSANLTAKHQATGGWLKPMVRVIKNMRGKLIEQGMLAQGDAPSYYLEGLLYNVPNGKFGGSYDDCFVNSINWIQEADRDKFLCANEMYYLLREGSPVTWRRAMCDKFLTAAVKLWNEW